jgi:glutathione synthase
MALNNPDGFVMKPQREGGGHNLFKEELKTRLVEMSSSKEREQYILMDLINAPSFPGCILKSSESVPTEIPVISELGIYGAFVR